MGMLTDARPPLEVHWSYLEQHIHQPVWDSGQRYVCSVDTSSHGMMLGLYLRSLLFREVLEVQGVRFG